eukprot:6487865-Amphidinium_carterae.1
MSKKCSTMTRLGFLDIYHIEAYPEDVRVGVHHQRRHDRQRGRGRRMIFASVLVRYGRSSTKQPARLAIEGIGDCFDKVVTYRYGSPASLLSQLTKDVQITQHAVQH